MTDAQLIAALEQLPALTGPGLTSVVVDRELTAGANRRTLRLLVTPADRSSGPFAAIAQVVERDDRRTDASRSARDEAAIVALAASREVPVAEVLAAGRLPATTSRPIEVLVTREVVGETIPRRVLRSVGAIEGGGRTLTRSCARALARLHGIESGAATDLDGSLPVFTAADYLEHLTERLDALSDRHPTFRFAINRLRQVLPSEPPAMSLVHGDFRNGNLIVDGAELAAILDWELAHMGDPMEDLAWLCLRTWRFGVDDREVGGFGTLDDLRQSYLGAGGEWRQDALDWWMAARCVWWGIGLSAQAEAFLDGRSGSLVHAASGRRVVELEYDLLGLLAERRG